MAKVVVVISTLKVEALCVLDAGRFKVASLLLTIVLAKVKLFTTFTYLFDFFFKGRVSQCVAWIFGLQASLTNCNSFTQKVV